MKTAALSRAARATRIRQPLWLCIAIAGLLIGSLGACRNYQAAPPAASAPTGSSSESPPPPPPPEMAQGAPPPDRATSALPPDIDDISPAAGGSARPEHPTQALPPHHARPPNPVPVAGEAPVTMSPAAEPQPHYHVSGPEQALHGPENKDITLLLSLDLTPEQLQSYYDGHFKDAKVPTVERAGAMQSYLPRYTHLRASIDCGDGQVISCKAMEGYPPDIPTVPGVMMWRWNVVGIDDGKATGPRAQAVRIVVLGAGDAAGPYERIDSIPDIPLQVKVDALTTAERLIAAWTHLADSIKALLVAVIAAIGVLTAWLRSTFKKKEPPAAG